MTSDRLKYVTVICTIVFFFLIYVYINNLIVFFKEILLYNINRYFYILDAEGKRDFRGFLVEELDGLPFIFFATLGSFTYHSASRFTIRFECKEEQTRDIPPLVYLAFFFSSLGNGFHSVHSSSCAWKRSRTDEKLKSC